MILTQDGVTREQLAQLLNLSVSPRCRFIFPIKPPTRIENDHIFQNETAITFLKITEVVHEDVDLQGRSTYSYRFNIKICIEDHYWEFGKDKRECEVRTPIGIISGIKEEVLRILQSE